MKKIILLLLICFISVSGIYAGDEWRIPDRSWEIGFAHIDFGFSNNFISLTDIFKETIVLDIDELKDGFFLNFNITAAPLYFSFNSNNVWGFGVSLGIDAAGAIGLSGKMLTFSDALDEKSDFAVSMHAQIQFSTFFHISKLKIKIAPSVYYPVIYTEPSITYTKYNTAAGTELFMKYDMKIFSAASFAPGNAGEITGSPGLDFNIGFEFPLAEVTGLKDKINFLDFSVGLDIYYIPMIPAKMQDYMQMRGWIGSENKPIDIFKGGLPEINIGDTSYGIEPKSVRRPIKLNIWADWRPFGFLGVTPLIGFSVDGAFVNAFTLEAGLKARLDLGNIFILTLGMGYYDRVWENSIDIALNFRAIEINLGASLLSHNFIESWTNGSPGLRFGLKFGW